VPTATDDRLRSARPAEGPVLVRVIASTSDWVHILPLVPDAQRVGVTVGDPTLRSDGDALALRGYDLIQVVPGRRPGRHADLLVHAALREAHPRWFSALLLVADRVFDLRFGPVHLALHAELVAHLPDTDLA
jgi:hypothetical protein